MTLGAADTSALPAVNQALEPSWVRHGSATTQKAYQSALAFEETLVEELSKALTTSSGLETEGGEEGSEEGGSSAGLGGEMSSLLPQALTSGVMSAGGLGMAAQLTRSFEGSLGTDATSGASATTDVAGAPATSQTGGTAA